MRTSLLFLSGAVLLVALIDFAANTWPSLREVERLQEEVDTTLSTGLARLTNRGAPPELPQVEQLREDVVLLTRELDRDRSAFFARSRQSTDYLFPLAQRPAEGGLATAHESLALALLPLQLEVREYPALNALDLGIRFPSATTSSDPNRDGLRDQAERVTLTQWILDCLRTSERVDLRRCLLSRSRPNAALEAELLVAAGVEDLVPFYERFLSATPEAPPRALVHAYFRRLAPEEWSPDLARYGSPPVELLLKVALVTPESTHKPGSEPAAEGGP